MKKILISLATIATLTSTLSADFLRVEAGLGAWAQTNVGFIDVNDADINTDGRDTSNEKELTTNYLWAYVKHPIPIVPNVRFEYSKVESEGHGEGTFQGVPLDGSKTLPTTLEMTQIEVIPYYNVLDNTFWVTLDLGIAVKMIDYKATGRVQDSFGVFGQEIYNESDSFIAPLPYLRARGQLPFMDIGVEAIVKYGSMDGNTFSDMSIKADYTFDFIPLIQPGLEVGYRQMIMDAESEDGDTVIDLDFSGLFFGLMVRF